MKRLIDSLKTVPDDKKELMARQIMEIIKFVYKEGDKNKLSKNYNITLGRYKEYKKRRWYDKSPMVFKAVKGMEYLVEQPKDVQKKAVVSIIKTLGDYYSLEKQKQEEQKIEIEKPVGDAESRILSTEKVFGERLSVKKSKY